MKKLLSAVALSAFVAGPALAGASTTLDDGQLDKISAGVRNVIDNWHPTNWHPTLTKG